MLRFKLSPKVEGENCHVGSSQGRKSDDERHRLRRGREKFRMNFIVTKSFPYFREPAEERNKAERCPFTFRGDYPLMTSTKKLDKRKTIKG